MLKGAGIKHGTACLLMDIVGKNLFGSSGLFSGGEYKTCRRYLYPVRGVLGLTECQKLKEAEINGAGCGVPKISP